MKYLIVQAYWYYDNVTGEFYYRIEGPANALAADDRFQVINLHIFHPLFPQLALTADLLILHLLPDAEVRRIIELRKQAGKPTVYEIADNFLSLGPWVSGHDAYRNPAVRQNFLYYASLCDACQYSTDEVAAVFKGANKRPVVFENQVQHFTRKSPSNPPLTIGWGGSIGHREDLAAIAPTLTAFCKNHGDVRFVYMGHPPIYDALFSELGSQGRVIPAGPVAAYYGFLNEIHVGLAPLAENEFNRCRSDVKFVEYAAHHAVPVLADATPYRKHARHDKNALIYTSNEDLAELLEALYQDPSRVGKLADAAFAYASAERDQAKHIAGRAEFYAALIGGAPSSPEMPELPDCSNLIKYCRRVTAYFDEGRFAEAATTLEKVLALHPTYPLAQHYKARIQISRGRFEEALGGLAGAEPHPIYQDLHYQCLTIAARELGNPKWRIILEHISDPILRLQLDEMDEVDRAEAILAHNPYDYKSLLVLSEAYPKGHPEQEKAAAQLRFIAPEAS